MKLKGTSLALLAALGLALPVSAGVLDSNLWEEDDEESAWAAPDSAVYEFSDIWSEYDAESEIKRTRPDLVSGSPSNERPAPRKAANKASAPVRPAAAPRSAPVASAPLFDNPPMQAQSPQPRAVYAPTALDDDLTDEEIASIDRWQNGIKNVFWEDYRGNNVRVEILRTNQDIKEMRLKFVQSGEMTSDPDGSITSMLDNVADTIIKRTCGKASRQAVILYERPSVEVTRQTAYDDYRIIARGPSLREYGFRCIY
ncbi:MAG: hypothetical protein LBH41_02415 [Rickettsiales bacterium]|jgi:hypothetical protein|nr:hypothetical protein [Rickettsiales bacterium]